MSPDFNTMSKAELRSYSVSQAYEVQDRIANPWVAQSKCTSQQWDILYVLAHRDDNEAFYNLVDRLKADNQGEVKYPCPNTPEDWAKVPELIEAQIGKLEK